MVATGNLPGVCCTVVLSFILYVFWHLLHYSGFKDPREETAVLPDAICDYCAVLFVRVCVCVCDQWPGHQHVPHLHLLGQVGCVT